MFVPNLPMGREVIEGLSRENNSLALVIPTFVCLLSNFTSDRKPYDGYQILRMNITDVSAYNVINRIYLTGTLDFFTPPTINNPTDVVVCPDQLLRMKTLINVLGMPYEIHEPDLGDKISAEKLANNQILQRIPRGEMNWEAYQRLETIQNWMDTMASEYPDFVQTENYGKSTEGRDMKAIIISTGGDDEKPAVWLDGGIHAREWISPATASYIANELIKIGIEGEDHPDYRFINEVDWYINPNLNPDGYVYTQIDRLWRKTRRTNEGSLALSLGCVGTDPNRNWSYKWGGKGTSDNPCSQIYRGPYAASEPEVRLTQDFIYERRKQIKLFVTLHSYSQMLFIPWGYDDIPIHDKAELMRVANRAAAALKEVHGTEYQTGSAPEILYPAAGGSEDYAKGTAKIKYTYAFELRDKGTYGFFLPPDQIVPTGQETFAAIKSMVKDIGTYYKVEAFEDTK